MIIKTDEEGKQVIEQLCDVALKMHGLNNLSSINLILSKIELIENEKKE